MKSEDILYRDRYNMIDVANPPKSIFTVEKAYRQNYKTIINAFHYHEWYELYYITQGRGEYRLENKSYLFQIMVTLLAKVPAKEINDESSNMYFFVQNTIEYINDHFSERITLNELADMNYVTPGYLSNIFKKATGFNISNYIQATRLLHAKKLLCETDASILEISEKCGFNDSNYFSVVFKNYTSMSPKQYRKMYS